MDLNEVFRQSYLLPLVGHSSGPSYSLSGNRSDTPGGNSEAASPEEIGNEPIHQLTDAVSPSQETEGELFNGEKRSDTHSTLYNPLAPKGVDGKPLGEEEQRETRELKKRDREVRAHEQAHIAAGGGVVRGGARYEYQKGPDGVLYAVGGEVSVDTSEAGTPEATLRKMQRVKAAALAPADPSPQDRNIAVEASTKSEEARAEIAEEKRIERDDDAQSSKEAQGSGHDNSGNITDQGTQASYTNIPEGVGDLIDISV
jgi:hypothetical protein